MGSYEIEKESLEKSFEKVKHLQNEAIKLLEEIDNILDKTDKGINNYDDYEKSDELEEKLKFKIKEISSAMEDNEAYLEEYEHSAIEEIYKNLKK